MRVNVYAEEMTERVEIISKEIDGHNFTGLRLYLYLPVTDKEGNQHQGPFMHRPGDDDSAAITFWGKRDLREVLKIMMKELDHHYDLKALEKIREQHQKQAEEYDRKYNPNRSHGPIGVVENSADFCASADFCMEEPVGKDLTDQGMSRNEWCIKGTEIVYEAMEVMKELEARRYQELGLKKMMRKTFIQSWIQKAERWLQS